MAHHWFRMYDKMLNDPEVQKLPLESFKAWINALCLASSLRSKDGNIGTLQSVSFAFRETESSVSSAFHPLLHSGLIVTVDETFRIVKWEKLQYKSDTSTERVRRHRKRTKTVTETPPEQKQSRADTEQSRSMDAAQEAVEIIKAFDDIRTEVWGQSQARLAPAATDKLTCDEWIAAGVSMAFCRDYFRQQMTKMRARNKSPPHSLKFFNGSLVESMQSGGGFLKPKPSCEVSADAWRLRVKDFKDRGKWLTNWGDPPGSKQCLCPGEVLREFSIMAA